MDFVTKQNHLLSQHPLLILNPASRKAQKKKDSITLKKDLKFTNVGNLASSFSTSSGFSPNSKPLLPEQVRREVSAAVSSTALTPTSPSNKLRVRPPRLSPVQIPTAQVSPGYAGEGFSPSGTFHPLGRSCVCFQGTLSFPGLSWPHSQGSWLRSMLHKGPGHSSCLPLIRCVSSR